MISRWFTSSISMSTLEVPEERLRKFKYRGKDASVQRRQQRAVSLQLREAKKDEQVFERRNITSLSTDPASREETIRVSLTLPEMISGMNASDPESCFQAAQAARRILSEQRNPPVKLMVKVGLIPRLVAFLRSSRAPCLQFEAAWALTSISAESSEQTHAVVEGGAVQALVELLSSPHMNVCKHAVLALGNIAGDGPEFRDVVISSNAIPRLLALISSTTPVTFLQHITRTLSYLCQKEGLQPCQTAVKPTLSILSCLLWHRDSEVLCYTCRALSYLTEVCDGHIGQVVDILVLPRLVELMASSEFDILLPSLYTVGNIVKGTDGQTQTAIDVGMLGALPQLLLHPKSSVQKVAAWALGNVATGPPKHLQQLIACNILPPLVTLLRNGHFQVQKDAVCAVANFISGGTLDQMIQLIHSGVLELLVNLLIIPDMNVVINVLDIIFLLLQATMESLPELPEMESLCVPIEERGGLDRIKALQYHENRQIALTAQSIIENHFSERVQIQGLS
ncbi:importin subunit alpha-8-like [Phyllostomus hastatus]|uniref:importin subunit alpha-8-like n=1 Tax=Phyllostomus hastatus TaxID=9423 RepID=UPI001E6837B2|nr:importin subunit alpha-8-like [Phyllostomus hastatus]